MKMIQKNKVLNRVSAALLALSMSGISTVGYGQTVSTDTGPINLHIKLPPVAAHYSRAQLSAIANKLHDETTQRSNRRVSSVELLNPAGAVLAKFNY